MQWSGSGNVTPITSGKFFYTTFRMGKSRSGKFCILEEVLHGMDVLSMWDVPNRTFHTSLLREVLYSWYCVQCACTPEVGPEPESIPAGFCNFLDSESIFCEKPNPESQFYFSSSRSLCGHFLGKNMGELRLDR